MQTLPTRAWNPLGGTGGAGGYVAWDGGNRDAIDMINDLVDTMKPFYRPAIIFDTWQVFSYQSPTVAANQVAAGVFSATVGTGAATSWYEAVQTTFTLYDTAFNTVKLVLLDSNSNDQFIHVSAGEANAIMIALVSEFAGDDNAWSSRAGFKPYSLRSVTFDLNDKLRDAYRLS